MTQGTSASPNPGKITLTAQMIDQITQDLKRMEGQEITEGGPIKPASSENVTGVKTLWEISYKTG